MHSDYFRLLSDYFLPILPLFFPKLRNMDRKIIYMTFTRPFYIVNIVKVKWYDTQ